MSYHYSLAHLTVLRCPPPELVYIAHTAGYDYVSPRIIMLGLPEEAEYDLTKDKNLYRLTQNALQETGLKVHDIELAKISDTVDVRDYEPALEIGAQLGAKTVISSIWTEDRGHAVEQLALLCDIAQQYNLNVNLEFVPWSNVRTLQEAKALFKAVHKENLGFLIDMLYLIPAGVSCEELDDLPANRYNFVHFSDSPADIAKEGESLLFVGRQARLYPGEGIIDFKSILDRMDKDLVLSIELPNTEKIQAYGCAEHARRCLETTKAQIDRCYAHEILA